MRHLGSKLKSVQIRSNMWLSSATLASNYLLPCNRYILGLETLWDYACCNALWQVHVLH